MQKAAHDGVGRTTASYSTDGGGDTAWSDAFTVTGDTVLSQVEMTYDASGLALLTTNRQRFHDETGTGALGTPTTGVKARVSYAANYYDAGDRPLHGVFVGTNGGSAYTRPGSVPSRSDTVLVNSTEYDSAGRAYKSIDPKGLENRTYFDALGRTLKTIVNYVDGTVSDTDDKTNEYAFGPARMISLTAKLTGGGGQTTEWVYGGKYRKQFGLERHRRQDEVARCEYRNQQHERTRDCHRQCARPNADFARSQWQRPYHRV